MGAFPTHDELGQRALNAKRAARDRVMAAVRRGEQPSDAFSRADLEWAFGDVGVDVGVALEQLDAEADEIREEKRERAQRAKRNDELRAMAEQVKREWARQAADELHQRAVAEAKKRLGRGEDE